MSNFVATFRTLSFVSTLLLSGVAQATILPSVDEQAIDPRESYLFYLHGAIYEGAPDEPVHAQHGAYQFHALINALAKSGWNVIAPQRPKAAESQEWAQRIAAQIEVLKKHGVPSSHIAVAGFSKGGGIAARTSVLLHDPYIRYALLAACPKDQATADWRALSGTILSLYENRDSWAGSCAFAAQNPEMHTVFTEQVLDTGWGHGEFYQPRDEWLQPVMLWLRGTTIAAEDDSTTTPAHEN